MLRQIEALSQDYLFSVSELLIHINVLLGEMESVDIHMVVKNVDGALHVTYNNESLTRSETEIFPTGYVKNAGSSGAASGVSDFGYLNSDAKYVQWYGLSYDMAIINSECYLPGEDEFVVLDFSTFDGFENFCIESYNFDKEGKEEYFYTYFYYNDDFEPIIDESIYASDNPIKKLFEENNLTIYPKSQIQNVLDNRKSEIGLSDSIIQN